MDTEEFQRLRKIRQLGPTNLVYPCANHTRFDHSLGTLYMAQHLIDLIKTNPYPDPDFKFTDDHILLIRICALVHDLAHVPFGHTLEDEGNLVKPQWANEDRVEYFLGDRSTIGSRIIDTLKEKDLDGRRFLREVRNILSAHTDEQVEKLDYPFVYDIVQNTICADLLDYIHRDLYFCGLREAYDPRFLSYFYITSYRGKWRLVLRLVRPKERTLRRDVVSETLHLLRLRYSLAEKVYYHHAKIKASAMIVGAVGSALENGVLSEDALRRLGDDELLSLVSKDRSGGYILEKLKARRLYKPVYCLSFVEERLGSEVAARRKAIIEKFRNSALRYEAERVLEDMNFLDRGQVIVYCPGPEMGQKAVRTLVEWKDGKDHLNEVHDDRLKRQIKTSLEDTHLEL